MYKTTEVAITGTDEQGREPHLAIHFVIPRGDGPTKVCVGLIEDWQVAAS